MEEYISTTRPKQQKKGLMLCNVSFLMSSMTITTMKFWFGQSTKSSVPLFRFSRISWNENIDNLSWSINCFQAFFLIPYLFIYIFSYLNISISPVGVYRTYFPLHAKLCSSTLLLVTLFLQKNLYPSYVL